MKFTFVIFFLSILWVSASSQNGAITMSYEPSGDHPFGKLNPDAQPETADFSEIIGICDCKSNQRNADGTWQEELDMVWKFKYIMNGMAIQDEVWRENGLYAGSIRQYHPDSAQWVVSYFSYPSVPFQPGVWHGGKKDNTLVFKQAQKAPNGMDGFSKLKFYDIGDSGFKWSGEWVDTNETFSYPFWNIECVKRKG